MRLYFYLLTKKLKLMSLSTKKVSSSLHEKNNKNIVNNLNIPNSKFLFSSSFHQPKKPNNIHTVSNNNKSAKKSITINKINPQQVVNKNSIRQNKYCNIYEKKNTYIFKKSFRSYSAFRQKKSIEDIKHFSNINKNQNYKKSNECNKRINKNDNNKNKKSNHNNSNSIKHNTKLNLNNLCNLEEYKQFLSNATNRKKPSHAYTNHQSLLRGKYKKKGCSYDYNKSNNNVFMSHNLIYTIGNIFTTDNSIYNNTDNNINNNKNFRNDTMKKYNNAKIYKDINAINFPDFQLPLKPIVSANNIIQIQNYFNNLYKKAHTNENTNNCTSYESNNINKEKKGKSKSTKRNNNINEIKDYSYELNNLVSNYINKNNKVLKRDLQNQKEGSHRSANNIIEVNRTKEKIENDYKYDGPEEMHFFYVKSIQKGKFIEKKTC